MATHYGNKRGSDEAANVAVARPGKAVGIAMHMKYTETSGSGSSLTDVVRALSSHFGYSQDVRRVLRSSFADNTWAQMVFEELSNGRPIIYGGNVAVNQVRRPLYWTDTMPTACSTSAGAGEETHTTTATST